MVDRAISLNCSIKTSLSGSDFANGVLEKQFLKYYNFLAFGTDFQSKVTY